MNQQNQQNLPNATAVLVLGVVSIITILCIGIISVITGGIGLMLAAKSTKLYQSNPSGYTAYQNLKVGKILCWIGVILGALYFVYTLYMFNEIGWDAFTDPALMQERVKELELQPE